MSHQVSFGGSAFINKTMEISLSYYFGNTLTLTTIRSNGQLWGPMSRTLDSYQFKNNEANISVIIFLFNVTKKDSKNNSIPGDEINEKFITLNL